MMLYIWIGIAIIGLILYMRPVLFGIFEGFTEEPVDDLLTKVQTILQPQNSTLFITPDLEVKGNIPNDSEIIRSSPDNVDSVESTSAMLAQGQSFKHNEEQPEKQENKVKEEKSKRVVCPSCPELDDYVRKDKIPSCPNLRDYVRKDKVPSCPDMRDFIRKDAIPCWGCKLGK